MSSKTFIANTRELALKKKRLTEISRESTVWDIKYKDDWGDIWVQYTLSSINHDTGFEVLVKQPEPNTQELIKICFESTELKEVEAAAILLYQKEEEYNIEFRLELANTISLFYNKCLNEDSLKDNSNKIELIIIQSGLDKGVNLKSTVGKHYSIVEKEYKLYNFNSISQNLVLFLHDYVNTKIQIKNP